MSEGGGEGGRVRKAREGGDGVFIMEKRRGGMEKKGEVERLARGSLGVGDVASEQSN